MNKGTKGFALGANIQPSQALCAFNAVTLGAAWGLPTFKSFVALCARETCNSLGLQRDSYDTGNQENAEYNERQVLTFLAGCFHYLGGPSQELDEFVMSLNTGAGGEDKAASVTNLLQKLKSIIPQPDKGPNKGSVLTLFKKGEEDQEYVDFLGIFQVVLCSQFAPKFNKWSTGFSYSVLSRSFRNSTSTTISSS